MLQSCDHIQRKHICHFKIHSASSQCKSFLDQPNENNTLTEQPIE